MIMNQLGMEDNFTTAITQLSARQHQFLGDQRLISNQANIWLPSSGAVAYSNYLLFISFFMRKDWLVVFTQPDNLCIHLWLFVTNHLIFHDDYLICLDVQITETEFSNALGWWMWGWRWGLSSWEWEDDQSADRADPHTTFRQLRHNSYGSGRNCFLLSLCFD